MLAQQETPTWTVVTLTMLLVGLLLVVGGIVVITITERAADGRLGPNGLAGIRTKATRSSDDAWLVAHRVSRGPSLWGGRLLILSAPLSALIGLAVGNGDPELAMGAWGVAVGACTLAMTVVLLYGVWIGHRAAAELVSRNDN